MLQDGSTTFASSATFSSNVNIDNDLTVSGGDISLGGTGRIQGVDTVSAGTDAANKDYVDTAVAGSGSGTVTGVSSATTSLLTVSESSPAPALSIVTAAVTNGGTALATGDQIYDATTTRLGSYLPLAGSVYDGGTATWSNGITGNLALVSTSGTKGIIIGDEDNGAGQLFVQFNSSNGGGILNNNGGNLEITAQNYGDGSDIIFRGNDTSNNLVAYFQTVGASQKVRVVDNIKLTIGTSDDLQIYHDGSNSYIRDISGTGDLKVDSNRFWIRSSVGETMGRFTENGSAELYYDNVLCLSTTSTGVSITGGITDSNGDLGTAGQLLSSTGTALDWIDAAAGGATSINGLSDAAAGNGTTSGVNRGTCITLGTSPTWAQGGDTGFFGGKTIAIGFAAMENFETGLTTAWQGSIAIGYKALYSIEGNVNPYNNIAIGNEALRDYNSPSSNPPIAIGNLAMADSVVNSNCIAIGPQCLQSLGNTNYGPGSTLTKDDCENNIMIGGYRTWMGGSQNVSIGWNAGPGFATTQNPAGTLVDSNTCIGYGAGLSGTAIVNCLILGNGAAPSSASATNEIVLGNSSITTIRAQVTTITALSDARDKKDIVDLDNGLDLVNLLKPRKFIWDHRPEVKMKTIYSTDENGVVSTTETEIEETSTRKGSKDIGFIAQELQEVDNEWLQLVSDSNPEKLEASYGKLLPVLVKAIQELSAKVTALENS